MASTSLSLTYQLKYNPQPSILRGIGVFERSLKGTVTREGEQLALPVQLRDADGTHRIVIGPESFSFTNEPLSKMERFGPGAVGLLAQFLSHTRGIVAKEVELRALLKIPVPNLTKLLSGLASVTFTQPRKVELRPEAMGKDHFIPSDTGIAHFRLSTTTLASGNWINLMIANRHDRVGAASQEELETAWEMCLRGMKAIVESCTSPIYKQALGALLGSKPPGPTVPASSVAGLRHPSPPRRS